MQQALGRMLVKPAPKGVEDGLHVVSDGALLSAAITNRRRIRMRIDQAYWAQMPGLKEVQSGVFSDDVGEYASDVHGDPGFGIQGHSRLKYEVMAYWNEIRRFGAPIRSYMRLLYVLALRKEAMCRTRPQF